MHRRVIRNSALFTVILAFSPIVLVPTSAYGVEMVGNATAVGSYPTDTEIAPKGDVAYTVNSESNRVSVVSMKNGKVLSTIRVGSFPQSVEFTKNGKLAYVVNLGDTSNASDAVSVSVIDVGSRSVTKTVTLPANVTACRLTPGAKQFACTTSASTLDVFLVKSGARVNSLSIPFEGTDIDFALDGTIAWITSTPGDRVIPIDWLSGTVGTPVYVNDRPISSSVSPDGTQLFVPSFYDNYLTVLDASDGSLEWIAELEGNCWPNGVTVSPDGTRAYLPCNYGGQIAVVDTSTHARVPDEEVFIWSSLVDIAINKKGTRGVVTNWEEDSIGILTFP